MTQLLTNITILVLAAFVGFEVISKVPTTLHTPLMSGTNAIHGIVLLGGLLLLGLPGLDGLSKGLLVIAVAFGTINIIGGFLVTDRMLEMFKGDRKKEGPGSSASRPTAPPSKPKPKPADEDETEGDS
jgi:NAD(P) transhydrogenase subunit alpha